MCNINNVCNNDNMKMIIIVILMCNILILMKMKYVWSNND